VIAAAVFDALGTLFDLGRAEGGAELERTLHHAASYTLVGEFAPFSELARAVDAGLAERISQAEPYDDAREALEELADAGIPAYVLTNGGATETNERLRAGELDGLVAGVWSVDDVRRFKPDAAPYAHAARAIGLPPGDLAFVSAHAWDVLGASSAGFRAVWVARESWSLPAAPPQLSAPSLLAAAKLVAARATRP
jgi:2-haloacid dehalogenase